MYLIFCYFIFKKCKGANITLPIFVKVNRLSFSFFLTYCESVFLQANGVNDLSPNQSDIPLML